MLAHSTHSSLPPAHPPPKAHSTNSCWPLLEPGALLKNLLLKPVEYNDDDSEIESLSRDVPISCARKLVNFESVLSYCGLLVRASLNARCCYRMLSTTRR